MESYEQNVFISYAWGGQSEAFVNELDNALQIRKLNIIRDKSELEYKGSIKKFMERIGQGDCVIVVISDKYLRSPNCMFELVEIADNKQFEGRVFPIVLDDAKIYEPMLQIKYIEYWEAKIKELEEGLGKIGRGNTRRITDELDLYIRIRAKIAEITGILRDMNALTPSMHQNSEFSELYTAIERRIKGALERAVVAPESVQLSSPGKYPYFQASPQVLRYTFDALIADKLKDFVGRQFVFDALDNFIKTESSGYFIIRALPGMGKSSLMAKLVNDRGYIHHFNIATQNIRTAQIFLENMCAQLIARYKLPHENLSFSVGDDSSFLSQCLGEAAANPENVPIVLAIDSLDESDRAGLPPGANSLYLPSSLPPRVFVVITSRPLEDMRLQVTQKEMIDIEPDSKDNEHDIDWYVANYLKRESMLERLKAWNKRPDEFIPAIRSKSQRNFMYLRYVLPAIEKGKFIRGTLDELPDGLLDYYRRHWREMRAGKQQEFDSVYEPIVCILGVVQEPVTIEQISSWTKLTSGQVKETIGLWREFLREERIDGQARFRIYHASFQDFLKEQVDLVKYDDMIADYYLSLSEEADS